MHMAIFVDFTTLFSKKAFYQQTEIFFTVFPATNSQSPAKIRFFAILTLLAKRRFVHRSVQRLLRNQCVHVMVLATGKVIFC